MPSEWNSQVYLVNILANTLLPIIIDLIGLKCVNEFMDAIQISIFKWFRMLPAQLFAPHKQCKANPGVNE